MKIRMNESVRFRDRVESWNWVEGIWGILANLSARHRMEDIAWQLEAALPVGQAPIPASCVAWRGNPPAQRRYYKLAGDCPRRGRVVIEVWPGDRSYSFTAPDLRHGIPHGIAGGAS